MKVYFRSLILSLAVTASLIFGFVFSAKAYESIKKTAYGEYRKAVFAEDGKLYFFDYEFDLPF